MAFTMDGRIQANARSSGRAGPHAGSDEAGHAFRFEAGHPAFASADRGDDVSARRLGQADVDLGPAEAERDGRVVTGGLGSGG
jgi:hypothetical protein